MFLFQALNSRTMGGSPNHPETPSQISTDNSLNDSSMMSIPDLSMRSEPLDTGSVNNLDRSMSLHTPHVEALRDANHHTHQKLGLSPSILDLLKPRKPVTRESEEVRLLKLYRCALTICSSSSGHQNEEAVAKPLLENITSSFLLKSDNLPQQLRSVKIASCKLLGDIYVKGKQYDKATRLFLKTIHLDSSDLNVWLRLARVAVHCGRLETAIFALDHILCDRPNHPLALRLSLPVYFATSEFENCIKLCLRCLDIDAYNEQAIYYIQRMLKLQPSLRFMLSTLHEARPDLFSESISNESYAMAEFEANKLRSFYRKKMDAEADSRRLKTIDFPVPAGKLTWCTLADTVVTMFDQLLKESTLACVLNLKPLLSTSQPEPIEIDVDQQPTAFSRSANDPASLTAVNTEGTTTCHETPDHHILVAGATEEHTNLRELSASPAVPPCESTSLVEKTTYPDESATPQDAAEAELNNPEEGIEKRRSSRARPSMDFIDTPSHHRARRSAIIGDTDLTTTVHSRPSHFSATKSYSGDRNQLASDLRAILPKLFRDLAENHELSQTLGASSQPGDNKINQPPTCDIHEGSDQPPESVVDFVQLLIGRKLNIVTLGICLMLKISQMDSHTWSKDLVHCFMAIFTRLKTSLPHHYLWPHRYSLMKNDNREMGPMEKDHRLQLEVLLLLQQPSRPVLLRLHCTYVELHLETLDQQAHTDKEYCKLPTIDKLFQTIHPLFDIFASYEPDSPEYWEVRVHYLWINYLMSSMVDDFGLMQTYLVMIKEKLEEKGATVRRNYSVLHGDLSEGYIDQLLSRLKNVSDVERITKLSDENCHSEVVTEISTLLRQQKQFPESAFQCFNRQLFRSSGLGLNGVGDCAQLLLTSLSHMIEDLRVGDSGRKNHQLITCYRTAVLLLDQMVDLLHQQADGQQLTMEDMRSMALEALRLVCITWDCIMNYLTQVDSFLDRIADNSPELNVVTFSPLRLDSPGDTFQASGAHANDLQLTVGATCKGISTIIDFLTLCLRSSWQLVDQLADLFSHQLISCVYEHLACLEQTVPLSLMPPKLRVYQPDCALLPTKPNEGRLLRAASSGTIAAPPSLAWLHLVHRILTASIMQPSVSAVSASVQQRYQHYFLPLLRQTVVRSGALLTRLTAEQIRSVATPRGATADDSDDELVSSCSSSPDGSLLGDGSVTDASDSSPIEPAEDDETVACVDDLSSGMKAHWPSRCPSLVEVLAQAIRCLLPSSVYRQITEVETESDQRSGSPLPDDSTESIRRLRQRIRKQIVLKGLPGWLIVLRRVCSEDEGTHTCRPDGPAAWWPVNIGSDENSVDDAAIDWQCMQTIFNICHPNDMPEYDSVRTLSISSEFANLLLETTKLLPEDELSHLIPTSQVELMHTKADGALGLPEEASNCCLLTKEIFYLIADYYMKNNQFTLAVDYYLRDLSVRPRRADTWAALALIYYSDLDQILNLTNLKTERVTPDSVSRCLRCFSVALELLPNSITLLIERGCLAYQLHSYATRIVKKSVYRTYTEVHVNLCRKWRYRMLHISKMSYEQVLKSLHGSRTQSPTEPEPTGRTVALSSGQPVGPGGDERSKLSKKGSQHQRQQEEEEWLCHYMLAKCASKDKDACFRLERCLPVGNSQLESQQFTARVRHLLSVLFRYKQALEALDLAGAKYPKKIIVYHKLPYRSVEAVEVYYTIHALSLKFLLDYCSLATALSPRPDGPKVIYLLGKLKDFLSEINECSFVTSVSKVRRSAKKRSASTAGLPTRSLSVTGHKPPTDSHMHPVPDRMPDIPADKPSVAAEPVSVNTTADSGLVVQVNPNSQEDFIDLTEDSFQDSTCPPTASSATTAALETIWRDCIDRCQSAMLLVLHRLPLHYKAMYRLADMYLRAPHLKDSNKSLSMLLGATDDHDKLSVGGLFKDRRQNNFFHGVWRIPTPDIDRSGNFAAHMYRSVYLTLNLLHSRGDWRHLMHIFHQLRKQPPEDKRGFLGEGDRIFLARRAFNLIQPTLLTWLQNIATTVAGSIEGLATASQQRGSVDWHQLGLLSLETLTQIYRLHCIAYSRNTSLASGVPQKVAESNGNHEAHSVAAASISGYAEVLHLAYRLCPAVWDSQGASISLQHILQRCTELTSSRLSQTPTRDSPSANPPCRSDSQLINLTVSNSPASRGH